MHEFTIELIKLIHGSISLIGIFLIGAISTSIGIKWYKQTKPWIQTLEVMILIDIILLMFYDFLKG